MLQRVRKLAAVVALALLAFFGGRALYRALASAETKIRWRTEAMVEGFNAMRADPVMDGIAKDFVDRVASVSRDDLRAHLAWMYFNEVEKGEFLWSAELDPKAMAIEVGEDRRSARATCDVRFFRRRGEERVLEWDAHIEGTLARGDDGWQWNAVTAANHSERRRGKR